MTVDAEHLAFLAGRRSGIGSSDAPMLAGVSPWGGPWRVWESKVNPPDESDDAGGPAYWGRKLEDLVARDWAKATGSKIQRRRRQFRSTKWEWAIANPDRFVVGEKSLVEVKVVFHRYADWGEDPDAVPPYVLIQGQHQMAVTDMRRVYVPVLFAGRPESRDYLIERNDGIIADLMDMERDFWERHVLTGSPPPVDGTDDARAGLGRLHPTDDGTTMTATPEQARVVDELIHARSLRKIGDEIIQTHENTLKAVMGDATTLLAPHAKITWKRGERAKTEWEPVARELAGRLDDHEFTMFAEAVAKHTETKPTDVFRVTETGGSDGP